MLKHPRAVIRHPLELLIQEELDKLEALGIIERTGEFERSRYTGELLPVYRSTYIDFKT